MFRLGAIRRFLLKDLFTKRCSGQLNLRHVLEVVPVFDDDDDDDVDDDDENDR